MEQSANFYKFIFYFIEFNHFFTQWPFFLPELSVAYGCDRFGKASMLTFTIRFGLITIAPHSRR